MVLEFKDDKVKCFINTVKELIKGTSFDGHVFLVGEHVADAILRVDGANSHELCVSVNTPNGGVNFMNWLAVKDGSFKDALNPSISYDMGVATLKIRTLKGCDGITVICKSIYASDYSARMEKAQSSVVPLSKMCLFEDFTINALYYDISSGELHDPSEKGLQDLSDGIIRTIDEPEYAFSDSPIRLLSCVRLASQYNARITKDTWLGMIKNAHFLSSEFVEAIRDEITKIMLLNKPSTALIRLYHCGCLGTIFRDLEDAYGYLYNEKITIFNHTMKCIDLVGDDLATRLAALYHSVGMIASIANNDDISASTAICDLKLFDFPRDLYMGVADIIRAQSSFKSCKARNKIQDKKIRRFMDKVGHNFKKALDLINAINLAEGEKGGNQVLDIIKRISELEKTETLAKIEPPVSGDDIIRYFGVTKGPHIGTCLNDIKVACFSNPSLSQDEALTIAEKTLKRLKRL